MKQTHSFKNKMLLVGILALCMHAIPANASFTFDPSNIKHLGVAIVTGVIFVTTPVGAYFWGKSKGESNSKYALEKRKLYNENKQEEREHEKILEYYRHRAAQEEQEKQRTIKIQEQQNHAWNSIVTVRREYGLLIDRKEFTQENIQQLSKAKSNNATKGLEFNLYEVITESIHTIKKNVLLLSDSKQQEAVDLITQLELLRSKIPKTVVEEQEKLYLEEMHKRVLQQEEKKQAEEKTKLLTAKQNTTEQQYKNSIMAQQTLEKMHETIHNTQAVVSAAINSVQEKAIQSIHDTVNTSQNIINQLPYNLAEKSDIADLKNQITSNEKNITREIQRSEKNTSNQLTDIQDDFSGRIAQVTNHVKQGNTLIGSTHKKVVEINQNIQEIKKDLYEEENRGSDNSVDNKTKDSGP